MAATASPEWPTGPDGVGKKPEDMTETEIDKLMADPRIKELEWKMRNGGEKFKLEVTNSKPQEIRNICVPEGTSEDDQMKILQDAMKEQQRNEDREKAETARRERKAREERMARSDVWTYVVSGAGIEKIDGEYHRMGESVRNGARVYQGPNGFVMSRECVSGGEGWIVGKAPRAYYACQTKDTLAPEDTWAAQEHGKAPAPAVRAIEPWEAVDACKAAGNAEFRRGAFDGAVERYAEAFSIVQTCAGAHGLTDELLGKLHGNRAEALLQLERYADAEADAEAALEYDPCFVKAYVRKAKALYGRQLWEAASQALADALEVAPGSKEVLSLREEYRVAALARSGEEGALTELSGLCARFGTLVRKHGMASEVCAILKQMPNLLQALKTRPQKDAVGGVVYESCPNHDAQVCQSRAEHIIA